MYLDEGKTVAGIQETLKALKILVPSECPQDIDVKLVLACDNSPDCDFGLSVSCDDYVRSMIKNLVDAAWYTYLNELAAVKDKPNIDAVVLELMKKELGELEAIYGTTKNTLLKLFVRSAIREKTKSSR